MDIEPEPEPEEKSESEYETEIESETDNDKPEIDSYYAKKAKELNDTGVVVIKHDWFVNNLETIQKRFMNTLHNFPEYRRDPKNPDKTHDGQILKYALGGFGALGNPASFHNHFIRQLRQWCMNLAVPLFSEFCKLRGHNYKLEQIIDRMMYRLKGNKPTAEAWHRDEAITEPGDLTFGGWINLDSKSQYLSCIKNTHKEAETKGFVKVTTKKMQKIFEKREKLGLPKKDIVEIPPGHLMIFFENTIHEVVSKSLPYNSKRAFMGWRLTDSDKQILPEIEEIIENQDVMFLKSGQGSAIFSTNNYSQVYNKNQMKGPHNMYRWGKSTFKPEVLKIAELQSGPNKGQQFTVVKTRYPLVKHDKASKETKVVFQMLSLQEYGLPMYKKYTEEEKQIYYPNRKWKNILKIGSKTEKINLKL